jgi:succinate-semialdehyde dehydrogenase / glutarate-semialdehyde dehydrogenase
MIQAASATTPPRQRRTSRKVWRLSFDGATERARILHRAADLIVERLDAIADVLTREQGKPIPDAIKEIRFGVEVIRYYAEEGRRIGGSIRASVRSDVRSLVLTTPVGVVGAITPWNYPVDIYAWKAGPALAAGCTLVVKPPPETPLAIALVVQCFADAGLPEGLLNDLPGSGPEAGAALAAHPDVRMITATASTAAGKSIMRAASDTLKRLSLELGGQCPFVVLDDANVEEAAAVGARRSFSNMGQICIAVNRIIVVESVHDAFIEALAEQTRKMKLGHGVENGVAYGPVLNENVRSRTRRHIEDALAHDGRLIVGGSQPAGRSFRPRFFLQPDRDRRRERRRTCYDRRILWSDRRCSKGSRRERGACNLECPAIRPRRLRLQSGP